MAGACPGKGLTTELTKPILKVDESGPVPVQSHINDSGTD